VLTQHLAGLVDDLADAPRVRARIDGVALHEAAHVAIGTKHLLQSACSSSAAASACLPRASAWSASDKHFPGSSTLLY